LPDPVERHRFPEADRATGCLPERLPTMQSIGTKERISAGATSDALSDVTTIVTR
jgi:hypothetical protein